MNLSRLSRAVWPVVQNLESRLLLSGNTWIIQGDLAKTPNDTIIVDVDPRNSARLRARMNGKVVATRVASTIKAIQVGAGRGDDSVSVELGDAADAISVSVWGGRGHDRILGDSGKQVMYGGPGNDTLEGLDGHDTLWGDNGDDHVMGGDDNDLVSGDDGNDTVSGAFGDDRVYGNEGNDECDGGEDKDTVDGGMGIDVLRGGGGNDRLVGGKGRDRIFTQWGVDALISDTGDRVRAENVKQNLQRLTDDQLLQRFVDKALTQWNDYFDKRVDTKIYYPTDGVPVLMGRDTAMSPVASGAQDHSSTNTQVAGVDEADIVETDGENVYTLRGEELIIADAATRTIIRREKLDGYGTGMYLTGDRLTVIMQDYFRYDWDMPMLTMAPAGFRPYYSYRSHVDLTVFDVSAPATPAVVEKTKVDGSYVSSRAIGDRVYLVVQNSLNAPLPQYVADGPDAIKYESKASYRSRLLAEGLPSVTSTVDNTTVTDDLYEGDDLFVDPDVDITTKPTMSVVLLNVGDDSGGATATASVGGWGGQVYASGTSMYISQPDYTVNELTSHVFKFSLGPDSVSFAASGDFAGQVLNQFAMDEHEGYFRVATQSWQGTRSSSVHVLEHAGDDLRVIGSVTGIAPNESLFAARFMGDRGYLVTFQQTDPLWTLDLSDPAKPRVVGELIIPGFSRYLHPISETHLLGLGQAADATGRTQGVQLSLFDVTDIANPKRVAVYTVNSSSGWSSSVAEHDHHAFSYFAAQKVLAFPVWRTKANYQSESVMEVVRVDTAGGFTKLGSVAHTGSVERGVRIGEELWSIGSNEIKVVKLEDPAQSLATLTY